MKYFCIGIVIKVMFLSVILSSFVVKLFMLLDMVNSFINCVVTLIILDFTNSFNFLN